MNTELFREHFSKECSDIKILFDTNKVIIMFDLLLWPIIKW